MSRNPETTLISKEERDARIEQRGSTARRILDAALDNFVAKYGAGDGAAYCCVQATRLTLIANPRSSREARLAAERAFEQMAAE